VRDLNDLDRPQNPIICKSCVQASGVASIRPAAPPIPVPIDDKPDQVQDSADVATPAESDEDVAHSLDDLRDGLAEVQEGLAAAIEGGERRATDVEEDVRRTLAGIVEAVQGQRADAVATAGAIAEVRAEVARLAGSSGDVMRAHAVLDQRVAELAALTAEQSAAPAPGPVDAVDREGRRMIEERFDLLTRHAQDVAASVDALRSDAKAGASRLDALERLFQGSVNRLTAIVEAQDRQLAATSKENGGAVVPPPPSTNGGNLLEALERQLQEAEARLMRRTAGFGVGGGSTGAEEC
jgi:hypothetical protein